MDKLPLSVSIISFNEEHIIEKMLESIHDIASEIIIVDSHSSDKTRDIAEKYNAKVFVEDWKGHVDQKNSALEKCTQDWILFLDCDEIVDDILKSEIINAVNKNPASYSINRVTHYIGKKLKYAWQPDWNLRLVHRSLNPIWKGLNPHDFLECEGQSHKLKGALIHYSYKNMLDHFQRTVNYAKISAESYHKRGKKFKFSKLILNPIIAFFRSFLMRKAFLDGVRGFIAAMSSVIYTFFKYSYLWEIQKSKGSKDE